MISRWVWGRIGCFKKENDFESILNQVNVVVFLDNYFEGEKNLLFCIFTLLLPYVVTCV